MLMPEPVAIGLAATTPDESLVEWLRDALAQAEAGKITGLMFMVIHPGGSIHGSRGRVDARDVALATIDMQRQIAERDDER
jgi:hypothetical protein